MSRYVLNTALIPTPGLYIYEHVSFEQASRWIESESYTLAITYRETAKAFLVLFEEEDQKQQQGRTRRISMEAGDESLVFRLKCAQDDPGLADNNVPRLKEFILRHSEIGLLKRLREATDTHQVCAACMFYSPERKTCHRYPPVRSEVEVGGDMVETTWVWPDATETAYCGEWKPQRIDVK